MGQEIGERQRWAWLAAALSAVAAACLCGYHWLWVLLGSLAVTIYYMYMDRQVEPQGMAVTLTLALGTVGRILAALTLVWTLLVMGWAASLADTAFPMVDGFPVLGWALLALTAWGCRKGPAACAKCCGVLCLFLMALYGVVVVFAVPDVSWGNLRMSGSWTEVLWSIGLFLTPAAVWYAPCVKSKKTPAWSMAVVLPLSAAALAAVTAGVLTPKLAASRPVPLYDLAQSVSLFGVVERIEPLLSAAMTKGVFALLSVLACACQSLADQLRPWKWSGTACCAAAGAAMYLSGMMPVELITAGGMVFWVAIPLIAVGIRKFRTGA